MDYKKAYDEALERARLLKDDPYKAIRNSNMHASEYIFPELRESEDEKIKKELIYWVKSLPEKYWRGYDKEDVIAWLEKQNTLIEEIKRRKEILLNEKESAYSYTSNISLGAKIAMLEELLAFINKKE